MNKGQLIAGGQLGFEYPDSLNITISKANNGCVLVDNSTKNGMHKSDVYIAKHSYEVSDILLACIGSFEAPQTTAAHSLDDDVPF